MHKRRRWYGLCKTYDLASPHNDTVVVDKIFYDIGQLYELQDKGQLSVSSSTFPIGLKGPIALARIAHEILIRLVKVLSIAQSLWQIGLRQDEGEIKCSFSFLKLFVYSR